MKEETKGEERRGEERRGEEKRQTRGMRNGRARQENQIGAEEEGGQPRIDWRTATLIWWLNEWARAMRGEHSGIEE